jgi:hypothetical protein
LRDIKENNMDKKIQEYYYKVMMLEDEVNSLYKMIETVTDRKEKAYLLLDHAELLEKLDFMYQDMQEMIEESKHE